MHHRKSFKFKSQLVHVCKHKYMLYSASSNIFIHKKANYDSMVLSIIINFGSIVLNKIMCTKRVGEGFSPRKKLKQNNRVQIILVT